MPGLKTFAEHFVSVDQVGADVGTLDMGQQPQATMRCPSIRLVPTSAPSMTHHFPPFSGVSVDQVGADVGTRPRTSSSPSAAKVSVDQVGADVGTPRQSRQSNR